MNRFKVLLLFFALFFATCEAKAVQIVYPKATDVTISSPVTFFIGNENPKNELYINNQKVKIHPSGGFYHVVKLARGENKFIIDNKSDAPITYTINNPEPAGSIANLKYKEYDNSSIYLTVGNNIPLRNAPDDEGYSRLQSMEAGIPLKVIGEYGNYYKIELARDEYAWMQKDYLKISKDYNNSFGKILSVTYEEDENKKIFTFKLDKKVPFIVSEKRVFEVINEKYEPNANGLDITLYNLDGFPENKYELTIETNFKLFGYKTYYNDGNEFVVEIKKIPHIYERKPLKGLRITLDPGHGGDEYGAIGCLGDKEKDINLAIALKTKAMLEKAGAKVFLTRTDDSDIGLYDRVKFSQQHNTDIFISIHANALPDSQAETYRSGTSTYYFFPQSNNLAQIMQDTLTRELGTKDDKVWQRSFAVTRNNESISILVEVGYMIDPDDNSKLITPGFQQKTASSILHALERYANEIKQ